jgi:hypothetical protein
MLPVGFQCEIALCRRRAGSLGCGLCGGTKARITKAAKFFLLAIYSATLQTSSYHRSFCAAEFSPNEIGSHLHSNSDVRTRLGMLADVPKWIPRPEAEHSANLRPKTK